MSQKWNLQDIRPAVAAKAPPREVSQKRPSQDIAPRPKQEREIPEVDPDLATIDVIDGRSAKKKRVIITTILAFLIVGAGFATNILLGGAEVTIHPKIKDISVQAEFSASAKPQVGELGYELLTLEATSEKQVKASGKENVSVRAEGKIFIYNAKNTSPQRLIKNTRFETKDGLIFRIKESVEVPGAAKDAKGNLVAGSIVADVFADGPGEQYNVEPTRFTVPGLKGTDQYDSVYAESTAAFTGGFEGEKYIIDEAELQTAQQALHTELRNSLLEELKTKKPAGFVVFDSAVAFAFDSLPATEYGESLATIKERARLQVPIFKESEFASFLADKTIADYTGDPVTLLNPEALTFSYQSATTSISDISTYESIDFSLKGGARVVWSFDTTALQNDLIGIPKSDANAVFSKYSAISNAQAEVRPFWSSRFPENKDDIQVTMVLEPKQ